MTSGIYCYYDDVKHRVIYVGKDSYIDENRRHKQHYYPSFKNKQKINTVLQNDLENNNINRYTYVVLEKGDWTNEDLNEKEMYYISLFNSKFNFTEGGDGTVGFEHSEETRKKISDALSGTKRSEETRKKISEAHKGKKIPEETRKKMSEAHKGKKIPEETRKKMSEAKSGENSPHWKNHARVIKIGFTPNGKRNYALKYSGEYRTGGIYKEELEEIADEINKLENKDEETIRQILEKYNKKNYARVIKYGITPNGKQRYALKQNGETITKSIYKEKLEKLAEEINVKKNEGG